MARVMSRWSTVVVWAVLGMLAAHCIAELKVDERYPAYEPVAGVSGTVKSEGSDTMNNLMTLWGEKFMEFYPNVHIEITGKGSSTAPPALTQGTSNFGPMSRPMKQSEINDFVKRFGYPPTPIHTAVDMVAMYVHKDNPIAKKGLTLAQIDAIYSKTRKLGYPTDITTWGDLGLTGEWANMPISLYGRNEASGTYGFFKKVALGGGDFKDTVKAQPGSSSVIQGAATTRGGIGYSGIGYKTADVAVVPVAKSADRPYIKPDSGEWETVKAYSLSRMLQFYINYKPGSQLDPLRREFIRLVFSKEGQEVVIKDGFVPIPFERAQKDGLSVGIKLKPAQ